MGPVSENGGNVESRNYSKLIHDLESRKLHSHTGQRGEEMKVFVTKQLPSCNICYFIPAQSFSGESGSNKRLREAGGGVECHPH